MNARSKKIARVASVFVATLAGISLLGSVHTHAAATSLPSCTQRGTVNVKVQNGGSATTYPEPFYQTLQKDAAANTPACVKFLQQQLNVYCTSATQLVPDGSFGPKTYRATYNVQNVFAHQLSPLVITVNGKAITVDGIAGPQTWGILQLRPYGQPLTKNSVDC